MTEPGESKASSEENLTSSQVDVRCQAAAEWLQNGGVDFVCQCIAHKTPLYAREDLCQDVAFALLRAVKEGRYQPGIPFEDYVAGIAGQVVAHFWKNNQRIRTE